MGTSYKHSISRESITSVSLCAIRAMHTTDSRLQMVASSYSCQSSNISRLNTELNLWLPSVEVRHGVLFIRQSTMKDTCPREAMTLRSVLSDAWSVAATANSPGNSA